EMLRDRVNTQIEAFQRVCAQQDQVSGLRKHRLVPGLDPDDSEDHTAGPASQDGAVRLAEMPLLDALDAKRLEQRRREPGQLRSRVDQDGFERPPFPR